MRKNYTALNVGQEDFAETVGNINEHELNSRFKILFLGDEGVGKTALIQRFLTNEFSEKYSPTVGMDFKSNTLFLGGRITKLKVTICGHRNHQSLYLLPLLFFFLQLLLLSIYLSIFLSFYLAIPKFQIVIICFKCKNRRYDVIVYF
mmetsp:Transcript_6445/g.9089  ORF Transcript_6445/g.9089 Transcript_6445/m.9089 type:complete len:147 (-) Transcript_6445:1121-1561(-)